MAKIPSLQKLFVMFCNIALIICYSISQFTRVYLIIVRIPIRFQETWHLHSFWLEIPENKNRNIFTHKTRATDGSGILIDLLECWHVRQKKCGCTVPMGNGPLYFRRTVLVCILTLVRLKKSETVIERLWLDWVQALLMLYSVFSDWVTLGEKQLRFQWFLKKFCMKN